MVTGPDRWRVMRVDVPRHVRGHELEPHFVHLLNLSPLGARVTHLEPWQEGVGCAVDLPPSLGVLRLTGRVIWSRLRSTEQTLAGDRREATRAAGDGSHAAGLDGDRESAPGGRCAAFRMPGPATKAAPGSTTRSEARSEGCSVAAARLSGGADTFCIECYAPISVKSLLTWYSVVS